jgi:hypothetical protein
MIPQKSLVNLNDLKSFILMMMGWITMVWAVHCGRKPENSKREEPLPEDSKSPEGAPNNPTVLPSPSEQVLLDICNTGNRLYSSVPNMGFATGIYSESGVDLPSGWEKAVNGVQGGGEFAGSVDVFSLDKLPHQEIVLHFGERRLCNGPGADFAVFENPFSYQNTPAKTFVEPLLVSVSDKVTGPFFTFPHSYLGPKSAFHDRDPLLWKGFAGVHPVFLRRPLGDSQEHLDWDSIGGDSFDLQDLVPIAGQEEAWKRVLQSGVAAIKLTSVWSELACWQRDAAGACSEPFPKDKYFRGHGDVDGVLGRYL